MGDIASPSLEAAVVQLVANKHACDALARHHDPLAAVAGHGMDLWPDAHYIPDGFSFFGKVFPFAQRNNAGRGISALVPARRTIGDAHRRYSETMVPEQQEAAVAFLQHPDRTVWGNKECATYTWIRPLGLFLAGEGKNRVSLFQRLGIEWIPACVSTEDYPSPERIVLYAINEAGLTQCWAALDDRYAEYLANPIWAMPVLQAYGVKVKSHWPKELPTLAALRRVHEEIADGRPGRKPQIDLSVVSARDNWENEHIRVSPWSQLSLKSSWKWIVAWSAAMLTGVLLMTVPADWMWGRYLSAALLGGSAGAFAVAQIEFIPMRRRNVLPPLSYNAWMKEYRSRQ